MKPPDWCEFASEFYVVEKTIEVVVEIDGQSVSIRIEAIRDARSGRYNTRAYSQDTFTLQPTYPQTRGEFDSAPREIELWVDHDLPWTSGDSADAVLADGLRFLSEECE